MSSQVVRIQSFTKGSLSAIGNEAERGNVKHRNPDIDPDRKYLNMSLKETDHGFYSAWNDIKDSLNVQYRDTKKAIAFEGAVITADSKFFEERFGWRRGEPMSPELVSYWRECYSWLINQIGYKGTDKNILSAVVHADEKTLHLQAYYLPVTDKWQEKVYAKDASGKVLRNAKGSPIQAKDENGKTIYKQVENGAEPKLSRTEFWRVRGGQHSYSMLQDSFHEVVGSKYGLERGEIGSNAVHRTKAQWEQEQLISEKERLVSEVQPYRDLNQTLGDIDVRGKTILPGMVAIKKTEFEELKEQAKILQVNRDEVIEVREREAAVSKREQRADQREQKLNDKSKALQELQEKVLAQYDRQRNLNLLLEQSEQDNKEKSKQIVKLKQDINSLQNELTKVKDRFSRQVEVLKNYLLQAYKDIATVVKGVGMLKHDTNRNGYKVSQLSDKQERLIDGIAEFGISSVKKNCPALASDMEKHVGINQELKDIVEPRQIDHSWDRER